MRIWFVGAMISAALVTWVVGSEADEIGLRDFLVFAAAVVVILTVQLAILLLAGRLLGLVLSPGKRDWAVLALAAILVAANAYYMAFLTLEQPTSILIACAIIVGLTFLVIMSVPRARPILALFAGIMVVMSSAQYAYTKSTFVRHDVSASIVSLPVKSARNVYLIGFESLQSPAAYRDIYGFEDQEHITVLREAGFRVLDSAYSADRCTLCSYAKIIEFARDYSNDDKGLRSVFVNDNSTFRSFRDSGYHIQFIYISNYFSVDPKNVDYLYPKPGFEACENLEPQFFYGLCSQKMVKKVNKLMGLRMRVTHKQEIGQLRQRTDEVVASGQAWLTVTHTKYPFHSSTKTVYPDPAREAQYRERITKAMPQIAENMRNTVGYIVAKDPNAVVVAFGDHGPSLYRRIDAYMKSDDPPLPEKTVLEDQHGILFAVYPADFCTNRMVSPFVTTHLVENLIACLNEDDSPSAEDRRRARTVKFLGEERDVDELVWH